VLLTGVDKEHVFVFVVTPGSDLSLELRELSRAVQMIIVDEFRDVFAMPCNRLQILLNVIVHIRGISDKIPFVFGAARALTGLVAPPKQKDFAAKCVKAGAAAGGAKLPSGTGETPMDFKIVEGKPQLMKAEPLEGDWKAVLPLVKTLDALRWLEAARPFVEAGEPLLIAGARGSGKTALVKELFNNRVEVIECNAATSSAIVIDRLFETCASVPVPGGVRLRPKEGSLAFYIRGVHRAVGDRYGTVPLHALLRQIATTGRFAKGTEIIQLERISFACSIDPAASANINPRFLAAFRLIVIAPPTSETLNQVVCTASGQWPPIRTKIGTTVRIPDRTEHARHHDADDAVFVMLVGDCTYSTNCCATWQVAFATRQVAGNPPGLGKPARFPAILGAANAIRQVAPILADCRQSYD
jgi:hypothetical protein